jgi:hypothetical protein
MNHDEAKFLLGARRPGALNANDERFAEALAAAERDPKLKAWHESQERFDRAMAAKLGEITPPTGLREAILAGTRASASPVRDGWWRQRAWLAAAAGVALMAGVAATFFVLGRAPKMEEFARLAMQDLSRAHDEHVGEPAGLASVQSQLAAMRAPLRGNVALDLSELRRNRCRSVRIAGREVFEICFQREGVWFHLYAMEGGAAISDAVREAEQPGPVRLVAAAWSDARNSYALVTNAGREALRRVL